MPYTECSACAMRVYSAASHARIDCCPHCGAQLPRGERAGDGPVSLDAQRSVLRERLEVRGSSDDDAA
jgi:hypothetical protein